MTRLAFTKSQKKQPSQKNSTSLCIFPNTKIDEFAANAVKMVTEENTKELLNRTHLDRHWVEG